MNSYFGVNGVEGIILVWFLPRPPRGREEECPLTTNRMKNRESAEKFSLTE
jgi:hypothetical protein